MTDRELMQQALDALEEESTYNGELKKALRARLAQPEQEPVAWMHEWDGANQLNRIGPEFYGDHWKHIPLYTAPPQRAWQGLTDEEVTGVWDSIIKYAPSEVRLNDFARAIEAKLKEKNA